MARPLGAVYPVRMSRSTRTLLLAALLVSALSPPGAWAAKGKITVQNCTGRKVKLCTYDKTDTVLVSEHASGVIDDRGISTHVKCATNGGCRVKVLTSTASCTATDHNTQLASATFLEEKAYWLVKSGDSFRFELASDDRAYFDDPKHQTCAFAKAGESCTKNDECRDGNCFLGGKKTGVCCQTACNAACQTCTAKPGQCTQVPYGQNGQYCENSWQLCDGTRCAQRSSLANGKACVGDLECKSGHCADGVCCDQACAGTCMSCKQEGQAGTCAAVSKGQQDKCGLLRACNGAGACLGQANYPCKADSECMSGRCASAVSCKNIPGVDCSKLSKICK